MATTNKNSAPKGQLPKVDGMTVGIVVAEWNGHITSALLEGALETFRKEGFR